MYDTRPDLHSYVLTAKRLWWVVAAAAIAGIAAMTVLGGGTSTKAVAVVQVPDLQSVQSISQLGPVFDGVSEAVFLAEDLEANSSPDDGVKGTFTPRPARPTIDIEVNGSEEDVTAHLEEIESTLNTRWVTHASEALAPAVNLVEARIAATSERLASIESSDSSGATNELEALRLQEQLIDDAALLEALESFQATPPVVAVSSQSTSGGASPVSLAIGAVGGAFVGLGLTMVVTLVDTRVRRRSLIERNGLPVVAVADPEGRNLEAVPASIAAAGAPEVSERPIVVASVGTGSDAASTAAAIGQDSSFSEVLELSADANEAGFIEQVRTAGAVVLVARAGSTSYSDLLEAARTAAGAGAKNVCAVILTDRKSAYRSALD